MTTAEEKIHYRTCPLCEATCGLEIHTVNGEVTHIEGDKKDPFSKGYLCPKGFSLKELHHDPERIREPMIRKGTEWFTVSYEEAFKEVRKGLRRVIEKYGRDAVGVYLGNPNVHNLSGLLYLPLFLRALGSRNQYSASTVDQIPKQLAAEFMYGSDFSIPIPDIDRTQYFLVIGANPIVSNGSLMTGPNMRGRLKALQDRGGRLVVVDPIRTATAKVADDHHFIKPGTDGYFLFSILHTLFDEKLAKETHLSGHVNGLETVKELAKDFPPDKVASICGLDSETIRTIARDISSATCAAVYGRMGTCTQTFGTVNSWLIDVINVVTGNLDREGGVMFTTPAAGGKTSKKKGYRFDRFRSRVSELPEVLGELPVACLAEEMDTPGEGQIRAFVTVAGNPILSTPNSKRLQNSIKNLDFMVSIDCYLNETTRNANVILPAPTPLERSHYDLSFYQLSVRNISHYSPPVFEKKESQLDEWEILLKLATLVGEEEPDDNAAAKLDEKSIHYLIKKDVQNEQSPLFDQDPKEIISVLEGRIGPERMLDYMLRSGPYGDHFKKQGGLSLNKLEQNPHGIDLGALKPRIPEVLLTHTGKVELAPEVIVKDVARLKEESSEQVDMVLIGRRNLRSNNSWMHNLPVLMKGKDRCTLLLHPEDGKRLDLQDGDLAQVLSDTGSLEVNVALTEDIMPGVGSIPHGYGHNLDGMKMTVAKENKGVNTNILSNEKRLDAVSGTAVLNGIPIVVRKANSGRNEHGFVRSESI
ncbi:molybdopterin-dependent oxidoreductase [Anaerobacillus sp. 1_MG-2023]|uniref:molybdopterin-dependent oxidoreductase n=1 Tax=Anaerobacillus sp. 1_MG-2023 TaxID=3062655 RepID=UPI0026E4060B|nr:molybdopterin-dependent oxidoreductase [Anaerobacillus sp. 1_MG-2023]MDO6656466.1 molybdopterin-dependent oxidoreductase [Anaerobacillus sp. 1_MG-2023]